MREAPVIADLLPDRLTDQERQQLLGRLAEVRALDHLMRQPLGQIVIYRKSGGLYAVCRHGDGE